MWLLHRFVLVVLPLNRFDTYCGHTTSYAAALKGYDPLSILAPSDGLGGIFFFPLIFQRVKKCSGAGSQPRASSLAGGAAAEECLRALQREKETESRGRRVTAESMGQINKAARLRLLIA